MSYTTQNSSDNFFSYSPDNHRSSDDVYWREGEHGQRAHCIKSRKSKACVCSALCLISKGILISSHVNNRCAFLRTLLATHTFHPQAKLGMPAFASQPQNMTVLCLLLISHPAEGRKLSWSERLVIRPYKTA